MNVIIVLDAVLLVLQVPSLLLAVIQDKGV